MYGSYKIMTYICTPSYFHLLFGAVQEKSTQNTQNITTICIKPVTVTISRRRRFQQRWDGDGVCGMQHPRYRYATSHAANGEKCALDALEVHARTSKMEWRWHGAEDGGVLYIVGIGWDRIGSGCQATRTVRRRRLQSRFPRSWTPGCTIIITRTTSYGRCQGSKPKPNQRNVNKDRPGLSAGDLMLEIIYHFNNNASNYINEILVPRQNVQEMKDQTVIGVSSGGLAKSHPIVCDFREKGENRCHCLKRIKVGYFLSHIFSA